MINWQKLKAPLQKIHVPPGLKKLKTPRNLILTGIVFSCALLAFAIVYVKREDMKKLLSPPSPQTITQNLADKVHSTDQIIFHQLSKFPISDDHISLKQSQRNAGQIKWEFSLIVITLPPGINFDQVKNAFKGGFSFFDLEDLNYRFSDTDDNCLKIDIRIQGFKTHELTFCPPISASEQQTSPKKEYLVAIVIDDLGKDYKAFKKLLALNIPITYSILPFHKYSSRMANEAHKKNGEVILHLPLEPWNSSNHTINHGTLLTSMKKDQILSQLERNIDAIPHITGVGNHMGSLFTENRDKMEIMLQKLKEKGLYFLDSRTTKKTVGYALAREMGMKAAERDLFIDNSKEPLLIDKQLKKLPFLVKQNGGHAIAIGHPHYATIDGIERNIPFLKEQGIKIVPLSQLVN
jgi:polysaccharide deacetylase 2 family uncharacterized protein YibQ